MPKSSPEKLAKALRANLKRRKAAPLGDKPAKDPAPSPEPGAKAPKN